MSPSCRPTRAARLLWIPAFAGMTLLGGCTELYRWPERMNSPAVRQAETIPADGRYTIQAGDTMYSVAFRYKLDFRELAAWNDIGSDYLIHPGQVIRLTPPPEGEGGIRTMPLTPAAPPGRPATSVIVPTPLPRTRPAPALPPPEIATRVEWRWPTAGAVEKSFAEGGKGIDIVGAAGQPVYAAAPGKVVYSGAALKGYGELIIIKHDDVHLSAYGYNRRRLVGEGATVAAGQPIAELGLGPEQKPALHFEIRKRGKPVDPATYLPRR